MPSASSSFEEPKAPGCTKSRISIMRHDKAGPDRSPGDFRELIGFSHLSIGRIFLGSEAGQQYTVRHWWREKRLRFLQRIRSLSGLRHQLRLRGIWFDNLMRNLRETVAPARLNHAYGPL